MSLYILDTDILTLLQHGEPSVCQRVGSAPVASIAITVLSVEEQLSGWYTELRKATRPDQLARAYRRLAQNVRFLAGVRIIDFDEPAIDRYADLRATKLKLGRTDLQIAPIVLERGAVLVTANLRDFKRVPGLRVEDWSK